MILTAVDGLGNNVSFPLRVRVIPGQPSVKNQIPDMRLAKGEVEVYEMPADIFEIYSPEGSFEFTAKLVERLVGLPLMRQMMDVVRTHKSALQLV